MRKLSIPTRVWPIITVSSCYLALSVLLRLLLWGSFGQPSITHVPEILVIVLVGVVNDLTALGYALLPLTIYLVLIPNRFFLMPWHRRLFSSMIFVLVFAMIYLQVVEYYFFEEFDSRFNLVAVDYLIYPHEVFGNLWESYPIIWVVLADLLLSLAVFLVLRPVLYRTFSDVTRFPERLRLGGAHCIAVLLLVLFISNDTFSSVENRVTREISQNGIASFFKALRTASLDYDLYYRTLPREEAYKVLRSHLMKRGNRFMSDDTDNIVRTVAKTEGMGVKMNVVVVVEESLGAGFVGALGDTRGLTPNIDAIAKESLFFRNAYATGTRTVRGLEGILLSFPPIPSESIIRRPGNENIANWGSVMKDNGYALSFIYGGFGTFDNMNYFFRNNGFEVNDRLDIHQTFGNIWGVCDEDLFNHSIGYYDTLAQAGRPFFSVVLTASNHKPYTFPEGIPGVPPSGGGRDAGVKYADYALGRFFAEARKHQWYQETLFIVVADHDARVYGRAQIPVERYRIPLFFHAPAKVKPEISNRTISQMDIAPTVLGMLGLAYKAPFYGEDVFAIEENGPLLISHNHSVALFKESKLAILGLKKTASSMAYNQETGGQESLPLDSEMVGLATAYYQTAFDQFQRGLYKLSRPEKD